MLHTHIVNYVVLLWYDCMVLTLWILNYEHILYIFIAILMLMFVLCFNIFNPFYEKTTSCQIISIINRNAFIMFEFIRSPLKSSRQQWWIIDDIWFTEDKTCFMILLNENRKKQPRCIRHFYLSSVSVNITPFIWIFLDLPFTQ